MAHHVAVGALVSSEGVLLMHRRQELSYYPDCWDFPGGHIEDGESPTSALVRELNEELGITAVVTGEPRLRILENAEEADGLMLDLWVVSKWSGIAANIATDEHDDLKWVSAGDIDGLRLAHPLYLDLLKELAPPRSSWPT
ncbi:NUDIX domain-containing protein [Arthrobacter flavus]|uniref:8-oxo-dGTP diphosphatase n=1 Tax=Arthrobacter flavus TaxID=95172 RepID=A0ABW4Q9T2_9MICC